MYKRYIDWLPLECPQLDCNPGMGPDRELNWQPFGLWDNAQLTEPHQSGLTQKATEDSGISQLISKPTTQKGYKSNLEVKRLGF